MTNPYYNHGTYPLYGSQSNPLRDGQEWDAVAAGFDLVSADVGASHDSTVFTGIPTAPTAAPGTNTTQLATTAHVFAERTNAATLTNKTLTTPAITAPTGLVKGDVGLGNVDNTSDVNKPVSTAQQTALNLKESTANKDATGGYVGMTLFKHNFKNLANTFTSWLTNTNTAARTYLFQDRDGTIADLADIALKANISNPLFTNVSGDTFTGPTNSEVRSVGLSGWGGFYSKSSGTNPSYHFFGNAGGEKGRIISADSGWLSFATGTSGTYQLDIAHVASAVNRIQVSAATTGNSPTFSVVGSDTDINMVLTPKGIGRIYLNRAYFPIATGTMPFTVDSTTKVTNLNADYLDGYTSADFLLVADPIATGRLKITGTGIYLPASTTIAAASGATGGMEVNSQGTAGTAGASFTTFIRPGAYAAHFGIDTDNKWKVGGYSMGAVSYEIFHLGNVSTILTSAHVITALGYTPSAASGLPVTVVSGTSQTAVANNHYILTNVASTTVTLPASPTSGDTVWVTWANSLATNIIARNGQTIMGASEDMTLDASINGTVQLRFLNSSWRLL